MPMSRNLSRRLERLEESTRAPAICHVITVMYVDSDGTPAGGYRIEGPLPNGEWKKTELQHDHFKK